MLSYSEALELLLGAVPGPVEESVRIETALGRCLAEDVVADMDLPPFDKSLVDGFALRSRDLARGWYRLTILGESAAGEPCQYEVGPAEAVRIMTGAVVPAGADAVQMVEHTEELSPREVIVQSRVEAGEHVLKQAAEIRKGSSLLKKGSNLDPASIGLLAAMGRTTVRVHRVPTAVVASTGNELVPAGQALGPGQIRDSNSPVLTSLVEGAGMKLSVAEVLKDDADEVKRFLERHQREDLLLISGGLSMGDRDFVHRVIKEGEAEVLFHKVAVKPGKPVLAARRGSQLILGLPGNPVSSLVTFHIFVRPAVRRFQGFLAVRHQSIRIPLDEPVSQKPGRLFFKPGKLVFGQEGLSVKPLGMQGSSDLAGIVASDALIQVPADCERLERNTLVNALLVGQGGCWR
jgi:molybdenum cofactor synthesis domain-containing protein